MKRLLVLLIVIAVPAYSDEAQLVTPRLSKPATEVVEGDPIQVKYDAAWTRYEEAIANVTADVNNALDEQFEKAADAGNLDLAEMWDKKKKHIAETGTLSWPSDAKAKSDWRKKYADLPFPEEFAVVVTDAQTGFRKAVATLKEDYEGLVKEYTKGRNLARAKALRNELAMISVSPPVRTDAADSKPRNDSTDQVNPARRGAEQFKGHWYRVFPEKLSWHQAKAKCEEMGGYLAVVSDVQEEAFIRRLVAKSGLPFKPMDGVWLGATDQGQEGRWVWVDGTPMKYSNWNANQPNNKQNAEHYLMLWIQAGKWADQPTEAKQHDVYFVCEWDE